MNYLPITLIAFTLNGIALLIDKYLITKRIPDPLIYIFYFSVFSLLALLILPFVQIPSFLVFSVSSLSTILWLFGAYFMLKALQKGSVSRVIPLIGATVATLLFIEGILFARISNSEIQTVFLLILGMIFVITPDVIKVEALEKQEIFKTEVPLIFSSSLFFSLSYIVLFFAYSLSNFLTVFSYSKIILIPLGATLLILPLTRAIVWPKKQDGFTIFSKTGLVFLLGQASGGGGQLLLTFAISLAVPALVNAFAGFTYVFIFLASLMLSKFYPSVFKENYNFLNIALKSLGIFLIFVGLFILAFLKGI